MAHGPTVTMENVRMIFRNFKGDEGPYNRKGDRNFCVCLDDNVADAMLADGWNIKRLKPRETDEGDDQREQAYLMVSVGYKGRPPNVVVITSRGRTHLGEDEIEMLDYADIMVCDLIVNPSYWNVNGKSGVKAYLKSLFVTIQEDELDLKYADIDQAPGRSSGRNEE